MTTTITTEKNSYLVGYKMPTHLTDTMVRAFTKEEAEAKVIANTPGLVRVTSVIEKKGDRGW